MQQLSRLAFHIIWVNPRKAAAGYQPLVGGMAAALPYVDTFVSGHSLRALGEVMEAIRDATKGGVDFAFEMAGSVKAMDLAYKVTRRGGSTVTAGLSHPQAIFSVPHVNIVAEERTIKGSYLGSCVPSRDIPRYIEWFQQGRLPVDRLLSETLTLQDINAGFDRLARGASVRQVIAF